MNGMKGKQIKQIKTKNKKQKTKNKKKRKEKKRKKERNGSEKNRAPAVRVKPEPRFSGQKKPGRNRTTVLGSERSPGENEPWAQPDQKKR